MLHQIQSVECLGIKCFLIPATVPTAAAWRPHRLHGGVLLGGLGDGAVAEGVRVVTGGAAFRTGVLPQDRTNHLSAIVLQHMGGIELARFTIAFAESTELFIEIYSPVQVARIY